MKLRKLILISGLLLGFAQTIGAQNPLITYPAPQEAELKDDFTVKVRQPGGKWQTIATYQMCIRDSVQSGTETSTQHGSVSAIRIHGREVRAFHS